MAQTANRSLNESHLQKAIESDANRRERLIDKYHNLGPDLPATDKHNLTCEYYMLNQQLLNNDQYALSTAEVTLLNTFWGVPKHEEVSRRQAWAISRYWSKRT